LSWVSTLIPEQFRGVLYEYVEQHTCAWLHPDGTDRVWRDPVGALCALSPDIPGHCAGEYRDDTDHSPGCTASYSDVFFSHSPVISWPLLFKYHHA
jgi:hypothetical protein